jgi:hypothetical protein
MSVADMCVGFIFGPLVGIVMIAGMIWQYRYERRQWNNGTCVNCRTPWRSFDMDSQGGRGYKCETRCSYVWISWLREQELPGHYSLIKKA